jgi:hypothetical protein
MTRKTRRIIFYFFVLIFIIFVPLIIFYALGYTFDWEEKTIVATGGIYLKSAPSGADIYINNIPKGKTTKLIRRLAPKIYDVEITKTDFHSWYKELTVEPELVAKANNILLIPSNPKISLLATESAEYSMFEKKEENLYYLANKILYETKTSRILAKNVLNFVIYKNGILYLDNLTGQIFELDLTTLKSAEFFKQVFPSFNQGKWILSSDNKKLLCQKDKSVEILWLDDITNNSILRQKGDLDKIDFGVKINDVIWMPETDEHLIIATDNSILITELDNRTPRNTINFITTEKPEIKYDTEKNILYFQSQKKIYQTEI